MREIDLRGADVNDEDLIHLSALSNLRKLSLRGANLSGSGLSYLPPALEALDLTDTSIREDLLYGLPELPALRELRLNRVRIHDEVIVELAERFPHLSQLEVDSTLLTGDGLRLVLETNSELTRVEARDTAISAEIRNALAEEYPEVTVVTH